MKEFYNQLRSSPDDESFDEWCERTDKIERQQQIRRIERAKAKNKARKKRKRTGR